MNVIEALLAEVQACRIKLTIRDGNLHVTPKSALTAELTERLREHRAELLDYIRTRDLDAERNLRDQEAGRGYDYDDRRPGIIERQNEHIEFVIASDEFGYCEVCGDPAAIDTPEGHRFCSTACGKKTNWGKGPVNADELLAQAASSDGNDGNP
jgi:hypothetical protein